ncbi:MAG: BamA/TamA family outer membrane protein [Acidobacteria bacterium]|nr:BamA/TamA family outer membrane protein [Acidobacteriota bacterium]
MQSSSAVNGACLLLKMTLWIAPLLLLCPLLQAQVDSRAAEIQAARAQRAQHLVREEPILIERGLNFAEDTKILERITLGVAGFRPKLGGLVTGSGFALGPEYSRRDLARGEVIFRGAAQSSFTGYRKFDLQFTLPGFANDRLFLDLYSARINYPRINYYGPGPDSRKSSRSNYRREGAEFHGTFGVRPFRHLKVGGSLGYLLVNVGPGTDPTLISAEKAFSPAEAVGIDRQADFFRQGTFVQYDTRDNPGGPRSGGNYIVEFSNYIDQDLGRHDFQRLDVNLQQYIPFFNKRRVIALRGKTVLTFQDDDQLVPFYLQPVLGGSDDLRGFRPFRFHDDNLIVVNAEYRWETFSGLDMALFVDAGKVFPRRSQWNFTDLEGSVGFGLRFNARNNVFLRLDVGFSHEGFQVWVKFNNIFSEGPGGSAATQSIF